MSVFRRHGNGYEGIQQYDEDSLIDDARLSNEASEDQWRRSSRTSLRRRLLLLGATVIVAAGIISGFVQKEEEVTPAELIERTDPDAQFLHMIIHSSKKDADLCKSLVSAGALNYPMPSLLSWGSVFNDTTAWAGGRELAQVDGVLNYLNMIRQIPNREKDVVIIVDGHDTWFQLRPDVMLERFFEINRRANNRIVQKMGQAPMDSGGIKQKIVFGAQRACSATSDDPACYAVPQNPLGSKIYGKEQESEKYLRSSFIMGELGPLHSLYERARWHWDKDRANSTVQGVMSYIYGEQEFQRELIYKRYNPSGFFTKTMRYLGWMEGGILGAHPTRKRPASMGEAEFGIGLDYESLLSSSTEGGKDLNFLVRNNTANMTTIKQEAGVSVATRIYNLPSDILRSLEPFWARNPSRTLPQELDWEDTSLYTNLWTGAIPGSIQHTSRRGNETKEVAATNLRHTGWKKMWFQPHVRTMLDEHVNEPYRSFAVLQSEEEGETAWWPFHMFKWRIRDHDASGDTEKKEWLAWANFCEGDGIEEEVFADGKPAWKAPRYEY